MFCRQELGGACEAGDWSHSEASELHPITGGLTDRLGGVRLSEGPSPVLSRQVDYCGIIKFWVGANFCGF